MLEAQLQYELLQQSPAVPSTCPLQIDTQSVSVVVEGAIVVDVVVEVVVVEGAIVVEVLSIVDCDDVVIEAVVVEVVEVLIDVLVL